MSLHSVLSKLSMLFVAMFIWAQSYGQCTPPSVTSAPSSVTVCSGTSPTLTVGATGTNINYQWQINTGSGFVDILNNTTYSGATTATLGISGTTTTLSGYQYRCVVRGDCTPNATSAAATLTVSSAPTISANPPSRTICAGANTTFTVTATGTGITYQWQVNTGSGFTNLSNSGVYSGATTATLNITGATTSMNSYQYRCVVYIGSCSIESAGGTLTVDALPAIVTHPSNATACSGSGTTFTVGATGAGLSYQWQINTGSGFTTVTNGGIYTGTTSGTLTLAGVSTAINTYQYRCIVSGTCTPSVTSNAATITINSLPAISANPVNRTICEGINTTFSVTASGTGLDYQWQVNTGSGFTDLSSNPPYSGATTATLAISNAQLSHNGYQYRCIVRGDCTPSATSASASLTVNAAPSISVQPGNQSICNGTNTSFSVTASGTSLTYQWQVDNGSGFTNVSNAGVYSGVTSATLNITSATGAMSGYNYRCVVSNANCSVQTSSANLLVGASPSITSQASNKTICEGSNTTFAINASNATTYQWQEDAGSGYTNISNGGAYSGTTTATLSISGGTAAMSGHQYRCVVSNSCTSTNSTAAALTVHTAPLITVQPGAATICAGNNANITVTATGTGVTYQWQVNNGAGYIDVTNSGAYSGATTATLGITGATGAMSGYLYRCNIINACATLTSNATTLTVNANPAITTQPSARTICENSNTTFIVAATGGGLSYQWQENTGSGFSNISNGGTYSGATTATLSITGATAGMTSYQYRCVVTNNCTSTNSSSAGLTVQTAPVITGQPGSPTICAGNNTNITVAASGTGLSYQWEVNTGAGFTSVVNSGVYSGANTATLNITGAAGTMAGYEYRCNVSNTCITLTSNTATLTVNSNPSVSTQPTARVICENSNTTFIVAATGGGLAYQWQENSGSGFTNITNSGVYSGATTATLSITTASIAVSGHQYRCVVTNNCTSTNTSAASLTVHTAPVITGQPAVSTICSGNNTAFSVTATGSGLSYQWQVNTGSGFVDVSNSGVHSNATTATLNITSATGTMSGYQYRCNVTNVCATLTSNAAELTVNTTAAVTSNPSARIICAGSNTTFVAGASGTNITYQWQVDAGSGFSSISNGGAYSGATSSILTISGAGAGFSGNQYRCVISNNCATVNTTAAALTVHATPAITGQPTASLGCSGGNTSFAVTATGTGLSYQWQVNTGLGFVDVTNGGVYSNATTSTLDITGATTTMTGYQYRCNITNVCATLTSNAATLTVNTTAAVTSNPSARIICEGASTTFVAGASGTNITYQWQENSGSGFTNISNVGVYSGATTATLSITAATAAFSGNQYRCVVSNNCATVNSTAASLTVHTTPSITGQPANSALCAGNNTSITITAAGTGLTYQWSVNTGSGYTNISNNAVYSGATTQVLNITGATAQMNGYLYRCEINNVCSTVTSNSATLNINSAPAITTQPTNKTACNAGNTSFTVAATGTTLSYQWQVNTGSGFNTVTNSGIYTGATTATLTLTGVAIVNSGHIYRCVISGACTPSITSNSATLTVNPVSAITLNPNNSTICRNASTSFSVTATGVGLTYQWQVNSGSGFTNISNGAPYSNATTATLNLTATPVTLNGYTYRCVVSSGCGNQTSNSAVLTVNAPPAQVTAPAAFTACAGGNASFTVAASGAGLTYQWQERPGTTGTYTNVPTTGIYSGGTTATLNLTGFTSGMNNYSYRCVITGTCTPTATSTARTLTIVTPPVITSHPSNATLCAYSATSFAVTATGSGFTYQWQYNTGSGTWTNVPNGGTNGYAGITTATLNINTPTPALNGYQYRCVLTNVCAAVTSNIATLSLNSTPTITTHPASKTLCSGVSTTFNVVSATATTFQWQQDPGTGIFANLSNTGIYSGVTTNTLNLSPIAASMTGYKYRCVLGNGTCSANTNAATLTVTTAPDVTVQPVNRAICQGTNTTFAITATGASLTYRWQVKTPAGSWTTLSNSAPYSGTTTATMTVTNPALTLSGNQYRCFVYNVCTADTSDPASLTINALPAVVTQPANFNACIGSAASVSVNATGTSTYQWQVDIGPGGFVDVVAGATYSGQTSATLNIANVTSTMNSYQYRCILDGALCPVVTSVATMTAITPAAIIAGPTSQPALCEGANTSFSVTATGSTASYHWQVDDGNGFVNISDGGIYSGATTTTLALTNVPSNVSGYQYRCEVSNFCTTLTSAAASIGVHIAPAFTTQPINTSICDNDNGTLTVATTGSNLSYQWQVNTGSGFTSISNTPPYSGTTTATLDITAATTAIDGYIYRCVISNTCSTVNSNSAAVSIHTPAAIASDPTAQSICEGSNTTYSVSASGTGVSYQWQVDDGSGFANLSNGAPYSGTTSATLNISNAPASITGYSYRCVVSNLCTSLNSSAAGITVHINSAITTQPANAAVCDGNNTSFSVVATGSGIGYQWQVDNGGGFSNLADAGVYSGTATPTLSITGAANTMNGYIYRCVTTNNCGTINSNAATLTIYTPAAITSNPTVQSICEGNNTTYSVTATGTAIAYQWQVDNGGGFVNVSNTAPYTGATTATLSISNAPASITGYQYRCVVSNLCTSLNSTAAGITIHTNAAINTNPSNSAVCNNDNTSFAIATSGSNLTYQWQVNTGSGFNNVTDNATYSGATTATMNITNATTGMNGYLYRCNITNNCATLTSNAATLTIHTPAAITADPTVRTLCAGGNTTYTVAATGTALSYQWQVNTGSGFANVSNAAPYTGATTATLSISNAPASITGHQYRCVVSNPCTNVTSAAAAITVNTNIAFTTQPANTAVCNNDNTSFTIATTGTGVTYQWQLNTGSGYSNVIDNATYSGATTATLNITTVTTGMNGYLYRCAITNTCANLNSNAATLTIHTPAAITADPAAQTICVGGNTAYTVTATGTALSYQWQVNTGSGFANVSNAAPYTGATTATLSISNAPASITGHQYRCIVSNPCTNVTSAAAAITVNTTPAVTTHPVSTSICDGTSASFAVATSGTGLTYQWQVNTGSGYSNVTDNTTYSGATTATLNIAGANTTMNGYLYRCTIANTCATQSSNAATLTIHTTLAVTASPTSQTICEGANTTFSVTNTGIGGTYQWQVNTGSGFNNISNAVPYTGATTATLAVSNVAASLNNYQYRCIITNSCGSVTSATASLTVQTLPSFTTQPVSSTICLGASTAFAVATSGTGITYQWQVNSGSGFTNIVDNAIYSGATAASLAVNSPIASMDGYLYRCVVTNTCYNVTSTSVALNINTAPAITTSPVNQTICETYNTTISVVATGSGLTYQWQVDNGSGFANVNNSGIYNGATTASLILSNIPAAINGYQYRCVINGVCTPSVTSGAATITVNYLPSVTTHPVSTTLCSGNSTNFSVLATGTNVSYQWEINTGSGWVDLANTAPYSNVTTPTLTVSNVTTGLSGYQYRCMVRGTCTPGAASNPAILTVNPMPVVLTQPTAKVICDGSNTSFNVSTSGAINYQWQVNTGSGYTNISNNSVYSGATSATLTLTGTPISAAGLYRCVIDNVNCTAQSNGVGLTVNPLPTITTHPGSRAVCAGDPTTISIVAPGGLTYIWQINTGSGFTTLSNGGIYSGATTANLTISNVSTGMSGYQYRCLIDNTVCTAQSNPATVTVNSVPAVTTHPTNKTICLNGSTSYTITGSGTGISYQWEVNNGSGWVDLLNNTFYSNVTTATLNITGATATMNGYQYRCVVRGTCTPPAISSAVSLTVNMPPVVTANPLPKVICEGNSTTFSVTATGTALNYQWEVDMTGTSVYTAVANGTNYSGATTATLSVMSAPASFNSYRYRCVVSGTCSPVAPSTAALLTVNTSPVINTQPSSYVTCKGQNAFFTLAASGTALTYQWQVNTGSGFANLSDNAIYTGSTSNMLQLTKVPLPYNAYQYRCIVTGVCPPPATSSAVSLTVHDSTYVIAQTNSDTVCEGTTQIFSVTRGGYPATTFQWEVNTGAGFVPMTDGIVYNGVTTPVLSIVNTPDFEDGNIYRCKLTGYCNYVYSQDMKLTVNMVPTITSHPADATVKDNANATFGVTSKGDNVRYRWQSAPNETDYVYINDNQNYSGTRTNVLTVKTSSIAQSGYRFRCIIEEVTDCGFAPDTSNFAILGVQDASAVNNLLADDFQVTLYPNPVKTAQIFVRFSKAPATPQMSIRIVDKLGRTVAEEKVVVDGSGDMSVNVNNLVPGVYMLMLGDEQSRSAKTLRFTKE